MTLGRVPANIVARPVSVQVALDNCVACHSPMLDDTLHGFSGEESLTCTQCHRSIGHPH
jgi:cytochrome c nitrite reductase small subunit